ncbi:penicillin-binding protein 1B [Chromatiales bacterium (ex Bugula neritina AB1)]|nr:penicillin-binding protein 1B [Chromatiales bacterium (ex Bugula neritina AB1)]
MRLIPSLQSTRNFVKRHPWLLTTLTLLVVCVLLLGALASRTLERLDTRIQTVFDGPKWSIPARVYARPLELYQGQEISLSATIDELNNLGYQRKNIDGPGQYNPGGNRLSVQTRGFRFADGPEPASNLVIRWSGNTISELLDTKGNDVAIARLEPVLIGRISPAQNEDRLLVSLDQLPTGLIDALLAVEDPKFYQHSGISLRGIARAMWVNLKEWRFAQGGSTLTQQLVKNLFLTRERSLKRKLTEWPMALILERRYEKDDILQAFANEVFFAQDRSRAIHGFGLASYYFFNKPIQELQTHQYALLVAMLKGPSYYNPIRHPERALKRRNLVLRIMLRDNLLDEATATAAQARDLGISRQTDIQQQPAYLDLVARQLKRDYSTEDLHKNGLSIFTNFDPLVQQALELSLDEAYVQIAAENNFTPEQTKTLETAAIVSKASTGEVVALVGGREARYAGFNRALDASRPIGSLVKPFVYLAALLQPQNYNLITTVDDTAVFLDQPDGSIWAPANFTGLSHGPVPLLTALTHSYNQAAVNTGLAIGLERISSLLTQLHPSISPAHLPSLLLGALDLSVVDVAELYQTLAASGFSTPLRAIREIQAVDGELLQRYPLAGRQVIDQASMHILNYALQNTMRKGTGRRAYRHLDPALAVAGKSGTSNDLRDSWFAGYSGDFASVVWMGNDDNSPTELTGSRGALEVWARTFAKISTTGLRFNAPSSISYAAIHPVTGKRVDSGCRGARLLPFHRHHVPPIEPEALLHSRCQ